MTIDYLGMQTDDETPNGEMVSGRSRGCGCCADDISATHKADALTLLKDYERELKASLDNLKTLRARVRKWNS